MRIFKGHISTNKVGSKCEFEFDMPDDATDEEIEEAARDAAFQYINWTFEEVEEN